MNSQPPDLSEERGRRHSSLLLHFGSLPPVQDCCRFSEHQGLEPSVKRFFSGSWCDGFRGEREEIAPLFFFCLVVKITYRDRGTNGGWRLTWVRGRKCNAHLGATGYHLLDTKQCQPDPQHLGGHQLPPSEIRLLPCKFEGLWKLGEQRGSWESSDSPKLLSEAECCPDWGPSSSIPTSSGHTLGRAAHHETVLKIKATRSPQRSCDHVNACSILWCWN